MIENPTPFSSVKSEARKSLLAFTLFFAASISLTIFTARAEGSLAPSSVPVNTIITTVSVGNFPGQVVVSPDSNSVYVVESNNQVLLIDAGTDTVTKSFFAGPNPEAVALSLDGSKLYAINNVSPGTVTVIDVATGTGRKTVTNLSPYPSACALMPNGKRLWVPAGGQIDVINTVTNKQLAPVVVPFSATYLAFTPDGLKAYVTSHDNKQMFVIDTGSKAVIANFRVNSHAGTAVMSPLGGTAYVSKGGRSSSGHIAVIDTTQDKIINTILLGNGVSGSLMAFLPGGQYLYLLTDSGFTMIDTQTNTVVGSFSIPFADDATSFAIAPSGTRAYVSEINGTVTVIGIQ